MTSYTDEEDGYSGPHKSAHNELQTSNEFEAPLMQDFQPSTIMS